MGDKSKIEWTDATWNPTVGCTRISEGCRNCYAEAVAARFNGPGLPYEGIAERTPSGPRWTGRIRVVEKHIEDPLRWTRPRRIFVNSMSDLFHESISITTQTDIFEVMARCPQHTFQVLTKRASNLYRLKDIGVGVAYRLGQQGTPSFWPLPNVHIGVSCEDQKTADERIPLLLQTPAAVRFVSAEPLLEAIHDSDGFRSFLLMEPNYNLQVIVGGESGPHARPMHPDWARSIRNQCINAGVSFFFKQYGEYCHWDQFSTYDFDASKWTEPDWFNSEMPGLWIDEQGKPSDGSNEQAIYLYRVGKKRAGRLLDGREWNESPEPRQQ